VEKKKVIFMRRIREVDGGGGADDVYRRYRLFANQCDMCAEVTFRSFLLRLLMLVLRTKLLHSVT